MALFNGSQKTTGRKPYERAIVTELTREEAKHKLFDHARRGDQGATELLGMLFPEEAETINHREDENMRSEGRRM